MSFDYAAFTTRNIGFVTEAEQERLRAGSVFICGTGGMGGAAVLALVRMGVGHLVLADIDDFEVSNMNRQVFAFLNTVDRPKAEATAELARTINPELQIEVLGPEWTGEVRRITGSVDVVINGTDDLGASLLLYRTAREAGRTVIDAYAAPLPSIYVTGPDDIPHEARLGYPTIGTAWDNLGDDQRQAAFLREVEHVMIHSSSRRHVDLAIAGEVAAGKRSRMSFAPMVISTGQLMAYAAEAAILGRSQIADNRGWFFNPYKARVERPKPAWVAALLRPVVRRYIKGMLA